jgi:hypothetical protein
MDRQAEGIVAAPTHDPSALSTIRRTYSNVSSNRARVLAKGARGGTRTRTPFRAMDFESIAAAVITPLGLARGG